MKILLSWLKEFIELSMPPQALVDRLTMSGSEVTNLTRAIDDWLFELEITPNRPDLLSHLGIARETAAIVGRTFHMHKTLQKELVPFSGTPPDVQVFLDDPEGCRRYIGLVIEGVRVGPSPERLARRLEVLGMRSINNVVDATNLCLLELGQPLHAFDLDLIEGKTIHVRRAASGEKIVTIDGVLRLLHPEVLVVADGRKPIAVAGIMGGKETEIHSGTKRVFLEAAWFDPARIHRSTRILKLSSESSYQFARGIDPVFLPQAAARAARMICAWSGGRSAGGMIEAGQSHFPKRTIVLRPRHLQAVLGMPIYPMQQRRLLERIGCHVSGTVRSWRVEPPSWRTDLKIAEDLYEEAARFFGYDRCPATLPPIARREVTQERQLSEDPAISRDMRIRTLLAAAGTQEIITYNLIGRDLLSRCRIEHPPVCLENPLSNEQAFLRPSLLPGLLETVARNIHRKAAPAFRFFEAGHVYQEIKGVDGKIMPEEKSSCALLFCGIPDPQWEMPSQPANFFHLKGTIQFLFERLGLGSLEEKQERSQPYFQESISVYKSDQLLGSIGWIHPEIAASFELPEKFSIAYAEINLEGMSSIQPMPVRIQPVGKVAPVLRDVAIVIPEEASYETIRQIIESAGSPLLSRIALFDVYKGKQVSSGKKSLAFRLAYSAGDRTLTDQEVSHCHEKVIKALVSSAQASLR